MRQPSPTELSDPVSAVRDRHAEYFTDFCQQAAAALSTVAAGKWRDRFALEHDNITAALGWRLSRCDEGALPLVVAASDVWYEIGSPRETRDWLDRVVDAVREPSGLRAQALIRLSRAARQTGDQAAAAARQDEAVTVARECGDPHALADVLFHVGISRFFAGDMHQGIALLDESLQLLRATESDIPRQLNCLRVMAFATRRLGDETQARAMALEARALARSTGNPWLLLHQLGIEANLLRVMGDFAAATKLCDECLDLADGEGPAEPRIYPLWYLGHMRLAEGELDRAEDWFQSLIDAANRTDDPREVRQTLGWEGLAKVARLRADGQHARYCLDQALALLRGVREMTHDHAGSLHAHLGEAAELAADEGDVEAALAYLREKATRYASWRDALEGWAGVDVDYLRLAELRGDDSQADSHRRAVLAQPAKQTPEGIMVRWLHEARAHVAAGDLAAAAEAADSAVSASRDTGTGRPIAVSLRIQATIRSARGQHTEAVNAAQEVLKLAPEHGSDWHQALLCLLTTQLASGQTEEAQDTARLLARGWRVLGSNADRLRLVDRLAELAFARGDVDRAGELSAVSMRSRESLGLAVPILERTRWRELLAAVKQASHTSSPSPEDPPGLAETLDREAAALTAT